MPEAPEEVDPTEIDALLDASDLAGARAALASAPPGDERFIVARLKLSLRDGSLPAGAVMQQLIQLMRKDENFPGAKTLYQEASRAAINSGQSNVAQSHPPPPPARRGDED
jgi:hypothetical protein